MPLVGGQRIIIRSTGAGWFSLDVDGGRVAVLYADGLGGARCLGAGRRQHHQVDGGVVRTKVRTQRQLTCVPSTVTMFEKEATYTNNRSSEYGA